MASGEFRKRALRIHSMARSPAPRPIPPAPVYIFSYSRTRVYMTVLVHVPQVLIYIIINISDRHV
eukprot:SAG31_NODE_2996_length_4803_cov_8.948342_5_plen_65_part_00